MKLLINSKSVSRSSDLQILEKNNTNSKRKFNTVRKLSYIAGSNMERMVIIYYIHHIIEEVIAFIAQKPDGARTNDTVKLFPTQCNMPILYYLDATNMVVLEPTQALRQ